MKNDHIASTSVKKAEITSAGIKRALKKYSYQQAIAEYLWNGFDAKATQLDISFECNGLGGISNLEITDNGCGISDSSKFQPFFESEKEIDPNAPRVSSATHGKNGVGRLTFFSFATSATWETVFEEASRRRKYKIDIDSNSLDKFAVSEKLETTEPKGTKVSFQGIFEITSDTFETDIKEFLCREFAWFLELNLEKNFSIQINGAKLDYHTFVVDEFEESQRSIKGYLFKLKFIRWKKSLNREFSRYYLVDSKGNEQFTATTTLNNKGDNFYHSVFIKGSFFDDGDAFLYDGAIFKQTEKGKAYKELMHSVNCLLRDKRRPFLKQASDQIIYSFEKSGAFPVFGNNPWDQYRRTELEDFIRELYQVEPKIFSSMNIEQRKIFVHFLNLIIDSGDRDKLIDVLGQIVTLDSSELDQLSESLKVSKLSNIIRTIRLIEDRYKAIDQLRNLVFKPELKANERDHIQKFVEKHYWIFGEQYHLVTAAEPKFEEALRRYIYHLRGEKPVVSIDHPDKKKEMDIFMVRQLLHDDRIDNVVVELKHPKINLGSKEFEQVKTYMSVILEQHEFNAPNMAWEFYLIGNDFDRSGYIEREIKNVKHHGEKSLAYCVDNHKIYVKKWSEIFAEFELRHKFLQEKLELERVHLIVDEQSADEVISNIDSNTAVQPPQKVVPED